MAGRVVRERCVLLLGKSGAGTSTVANHLVGHDPLSPNIPPFGFGTDTVLASVTREFQHETVEFMWENVLYRLTVVKHIGLFDTQTPNNVLSIKTILGIDDIDFDGVVQYIRENRLRIDLILFVLKKGRLSTEEEEVFSFIRAAESRKSRSALAIAGCPISSISALVVTGCELDDTTTREQLVQEFKVHPSARKIASLMGMGIYPVGFPPLSRLPPVFQQAYIPQMVKDRDMLLDLILQGRERGEQHYF